MLQSSFTTAFMSYIFNNEIFRITAILPWRYITSSISNINFELKPHHLKLLDLQNDERPFLLRNHHLLLV